MESSLIDQASVTGSFPLGCRDSEALRGKEKGPICHIHTGLQLHCSGKLSRDKHTHQIQLKLMELSVLPLLLGSQGYRHSRTLSGLSNEVSQSEQRYWRNWGDYRLHHILSSLLFLTQPECTVASQYTASLCNYSLLQPVLSVCPSLSSSSSMSAV